MSARRTGTAAAAAVPAAAPAAEAAEATGRRQRNATPFAATAAAPAANGTGANAGAFRDDLLKPVTGGRIPVTNSAPPPKVKSQKNGDPLKMTLRKVFTAYMGLPTDERKKVHEAEGFSDWLKKTRAFVDDWTRLGEQLTGKKQPGFVDARFASLFSPAILAKYNLKLGDAVVYEEGAKEPTNVGPLTNHIGNFLGGFTNEQSAKDLVNILITHNPEVFAVAAPKDGNGKSRHYVIPEAILTYLGEHVSKAVAEKLSNGKTKSDGLASNSFFTVIWDNLRQSKPALPNPETGYPGDEAYIADPANIASLRKEMSLIADTLYYLKNKDKKSKGKKGEEEEADDGAEDDS